MATSSSGPGEAAQAADSRRLILDTAARLFRSEGYAGTSLRDIAGAAGMKAASLYHHFVSKDAIVGEVLAIGVQQVHETARAAVAALPEQADARTLLASAIHAHLQGMHGLQDYTSANLRIFGQVPAAVREAHLPARDAYERWWAALLARCARQGGFDPRRDLRLARLFLFSAMNGSLDWFQGGALSLRAVAEELAELVLDGLRLRPGAAPQPSPPARTPRR